MPQRSPIMKCLGAFAFAFAIHQASIAFFVNTSYATGVVALASLGIILMTFLVIRFSDQNFRGRGFIIPKRAKRLFAVSLLLAFVYVFAIIFLPGSISGFEAVPGIPISLDLLYSIGNILLAVLAAEMVFRGFIQTGLEKAAGSYVSIAAVSVFFTLYMVPLRTYFTADATQVLGIALPFLAESVFLCLFFNETKTLLCTVAFAATATILQMLTPLEPLASEYIIVISLMCYLFLVPIMQLFVTDVKEQNSRTEAAPEVYAEDQMDDVRGSGNVSNDNSHSDDQQDFK